MEALAALAQCYMKQNDDEAAMKKLTEYQALTTQDNNAKETDALIGQKADAEKHLANLYWKKGEKDKALKYFTDFFQDAKADKLAKGRKVLNEARIACGLAKGTMNIDAHIKNILKSREGDGIFDLVEQRHKNDKAK